MSFIDRKTQLLRITVDNNDYQKSFQNLTFPYYTTAYDQAQFELENTANSFENEGYFEFP